MQPIFVTIAEPTLERALDRISTLPREGVGIELRVDTLASDLTVDDLRFVRARVSQQLMYTRRSRYDRVASDQELIAALESGFDFADLEIDPSDPAVPHALRPYAGRILLSHHDYQSVPADLDELAARMAAVGAFKIAATPHTLDENRFLLRCQRAHGGRGAVFGMGSAGLFSRTLSPSLGGIVSFAAASADAAGAPGQLTLDRMLPLVHRDAATRYTFAIAGNPVSHSLSPRIHNEIFQRHDAPAAYGLLQSDSIDEVLAAMADGRDCAPDGISITAPFKRQAFEWLIASGAEVDSRAVAAGSVNTAGRIGDRVVAVNTDIDGFITLLERLNPAFAQPILIVGAGGTARAAAVAVRELGRDGVIANRTFETAREIAEANGLSALPLSRANELSPAVVIDTLPQGSEWSAVDLVHRTGAALIRADYSAVRPEYDVLRPVTNVFDGIDLLRAQSAPQARFFLEVCGIRLDTLPDVPEVSC